MPHFSSTSAAGTTSELIRLWRSRLKASPAKHHDNPLPPPPLPTPLTTTLLLPPPLQPPPDEGVLSQQSKMSEAQDSSVLERRQSSDSGITRQKSGERVVDDERENSQQRDSAPSTPKLENQQQQQQLEKKTEMLASAQQQQQQQQRNQQSQPQQQQQRPSVGECNLLPVLVERLRSALEQSCSASPSCSEDNSSSSIVSQQLPVSGFEDSGVDSEEDLRLWTSLNEQTSLQHKPKLDLKFLEDILLADIHTALARLQDTLKRVDVNTLTRYNASLDSSNKLYLLRLISNLLAKLKVPEEAKISEPESISNAGGRFQNFRRRKNDRHTISVSADEVARARLWLDDSSSESSPRIVLEKNHDASERIVEGAPSTEQTHLENSSVKSTFSDKCMKDAINQQQSLQNKKDVSRRFDNLCKDDIGLSENKERRSSVFYPRHNKFTAKKSKLKRANTIDIPNYLQLKSDSPEQIQNGCFALRRPIDVSDRINVNGTKKVVPLFEPKTDNDRKFLALINKNTDGNTNGTNSGGPFKSFSYRHPATVADKNWQNRFSSIKTNFDKHANDSDSDATPQPSKRKTGIVDVRKKFEISQNHEDTDGSGMRVPYGPAKQKQSSFTHAPTSPFQKIESRKMESVPAFLKPGYAPQTANKSAGGLQAKLKMFDQEVAKNNKPASQQQQPQPVVEPLKKISSAAVENGHHNDLNYYSFCKRFAPFASGKQDGKLSSVDATKNKLLTNLTKEPDKSLPKKDKSKDVKGFLGKQDAEDNRYDFSKQYSYHKPMYDACQETYRQLDKKPTFNTNYVKPENKRFEAPTQSVAVQTTNESSERRPSEPELINSIADFHHRDYPVPMPRKHQRNSVSVQTTASPNVILPPIYIQPKSPNLISPIPPTATSPSVVSPIPYPPQPSYKPQAYEPPSSYYNHPNYLSDQNYYTTDNNVYPSYHQQSSNQSYAPIVSESRPIHNDSRPIDSLSSHLPISQKLYNEFSKLPEPQPPTRDYIPPDIPPTYIPVVSPYEEKEDIVPFKPIINVEPDLSEEHIENQELSSDGIVTRYTSAIATVSSMPESPEPLATSSPQSYEPVVPRIKEAQPRHFAETTTIPVPCTERKIPSPAEEIQRHNMLQQSLIRRIQNEQHQQQDKIPARRFSQEIPRKETRSPPSPTMVGRVCALKALNESHKAQEKIHMFEEKKHNSKQVFRPLNVPSKLNPPQPKIQNERSPRRSPIDSSDEYLMSCANKPTRNIVLSKSESWHQLALASKGGLLQPPQPTQQKPPKPKSPSSLRFSKQFEASAAADNVKKMEEKVQQYFHSSGSHGHEESKQSKSKSRRSLQSKKTMNSLARSHTMPHLYDDRLFDDTVDVDQAFDSIFKEATRSDNRL